MADGTPPIAMKFVREEGELEIEITKDGKVDFVIDDDFDPFKAYVPISWDDADTLARWLLATIPQMRGGK